MGHCEWLATWVDGGVLSMIPSGQIDSSDKREAWARYTSKYYRDRRWAIENHFKIRTKEQTLIKLRLNEAQDRLFGIVEDMEAQDLPVRIIGVKPRRVGLSTGIQALFFHRASTRKLQISDLFYNERPWKARTRKAT